MVWQHGGIKVEQTVDKIHVVAADGSSPSGVDDTQCESAETHDVEPDDSSPNQIVDTQVEHAEADHHDKPQADQMDMDHV